jgi:hypothetical protein
VYQQEWSYAEFVIKNREGYYMRKKFLWLLMFVFSISCAQKQELVKKERFFWPPPPNDPKVEFIGVYRGNRDMPKKFSFIRQITGETEPEINLRKPLHITSDGEGLVVVTDLLPYGGLVFDFNENKVELITPEPTFQFATGVVFDKERLYVADGKAGNIKVFTKKDRKPLYTIGDGELQSPNGLAINEDLRRLYVVDTKAYKVFVYDIDTKKLLFSFGKPGDQEGEFNRPWGVCIDKKGDVYISDGLNARIQIFDKDGKFITMFGKRGDKPGGFAQVKGVGIDSDNNIYVIDPLKAIQVFNREGQLLGLVGAPGTKGIGAMSLPMGLYIDKNDRIYVVDQMNRRFQVFQYMNEDYKKKNPVDFSEKTK